MYHPPRKVEYDGSSSERGPVGIWRWILAGGVYFAKMLIFNREVLDTEPGEDVFAAAPAMTE